MSPRISRTPGLLHAPQQQPDALEHELRIAAALDDEVASSTPSTTGALQPDRRRPGAGRAEQLEAGVGRHQLHQRGRVDRLVGLPGERAAGSRRPPATQATIASRGSPPLGERRLDLGAAGRAPSAARPRPASRQRGRQRGGRPAPAPQAATRRGQAGLHATRRSLHGATAEPPLNSSPHDGRCSPSTPPGERMTIALAARRPALVATSARAAAARPRRRCCRRSSACSARPASASPISTRSPSAAARAPSPACAPRARSRRAWPSAPASRCCRSTACSSSPRTRAAGAAPFRVWALIDARMDQIYAAEYRFADGRWTTLRRRRC